MKVMGLYVTQDMLAGERSVLECGCYVLVGKRLDNGETATGAAPCCEAHMPLVERFNDLMRWSLLDGGVDRPLLDVVDELLERAAKEG